MVFTTLVAPLDKVDHGLPPALWMIVARAGALLALALAFRLARRLAGGGPAGALGGAVAAVVLFLTPDWFQFAAHGSEAPMAVALMLWAIERHLDGRAGPRPRARNAGLPAAPGAVAVPGALRALGVARASRGCGRCVVGAFVLLPLAWVGPEWIGSGMPVRRRRSGAQPARLEPLARRAPVAAGAPARAQPRRPAVELLAGVAVHVAAVKRNAAVLVLAGAALAEVALFVAMTQAGFSGNPRYVLPALAVSSVLAGVGAAYLAEVVPALAGSRWRLAGVVAAVGVARAGRARLPDRARDSPRRRGEGGGGAHAAAPDLARAVQEAGGAEAVKALGWATTNRALQTRLAWELGVPMELTESLTDYRVVFRSSREPLVGRVYMTGRARYRRTLARVGSFRVYRRDGITFPRSPPRVEGFGWAVYRTFAGNSHPSRPWEDSRSSG